MDTNEILLLIVMVPWILGMWVAMAVQFRRMNARIRHRVQATGRPVGGEYALALMAWSAVKAALWPFTLVVWLLTGRSRPATA